MKEELLKSVASPSQVFYAPFKLAIFNVVANICMMALLLAFRMFGYIWAPILALVLLHMALILVGRREPHIDTMLIARGRIKRGTKNIIKEDGKKFTA
ncbi:MAG: hypothetical protein LBO78_03675 [Rickettsiales bacterium]|jgi:hypothetical protein|nr:hypothetical protein [Rickettsiales bacterium]